MPGPLEDRLSRFTPSAAGIDRDDLLFAAGRASARPNRGWVALAALLALGQAVTLAVLWPRAAEPVPVPIVAPAVQPDGVQPGPAESEPIGPPLLRAWQRDLEDCGTEVPPLDLVPDAPPLRASSLDTFLAN